MIEVLQVLSHLIQYVLHCDVYLFHDSFVDISYYLLNNFELLEKFAAGLQHILREYVLFTIHPKVRESFLRRVQNLCQVAKGSLLVQYLVSLGELLTVFPRGTYSLEAFAKSFDLVQETLACALSVL